jgi:hypothetical protein
LTYYIFAGQNFYFSHHIQTLNIFQAGIVEEANPFLIRPFIKGVLISCTEGWVAGSERLVEVYDEPSAMVLDVEGCGEFFIGKDGLQIGKSDQQGELSSLDREIILGPVLVLALALRGVWSLHASAAKYKEKVVVFLGESGQGKSTLAEYLSRNEQWQLVADDILPVKMDASGLNVLPRFPQLKLPVDSQPGIDLPEQLPLSMLVVLEHAEASQMPELKKLLIAQTVQSLLSHTAGTRMFTPSLLSQHLEFSTRAAQQIPAFKLIYPHRRDTLQQIKDFLEKAC